MRGRPAVFVDRDGVLNDQTAFVNSPEDFNLLAGAAAAVARLNRAGLPVVVITNQGGIALGYLTEDTLAAIHERMTALLAAEGAHVDAVYYCPHYPGATTGKPLVEGSRIVTQASASSLPAAAAETAAIDPRRCTTDAAPNCPHLANATVTRYLKECPCRKPGTGMIEKARDELGIDLSASVLVGDATTDILAGIRAGCRTILVRTGYAGRDGKAGAEPDHTVADLAGAVDLILSELSI